VTEGEGLGSWLWEKGGEEGRAGCGRRPDQRLGGPALSVAEAGDNCEAVLVMCPGLRRDCCEAGDSVRAVARDLHGRRRKA